MLREEVAEGPVVVFFLERVEERGERERGENGRERKKAKRDRTLLPLPPLSSPQRRARDHLRGQRPPLECELVGLPGAGRQSAPAAHWKREMRKEGERAAREDDRTKGREIVKAMELSVCSVFCAGRFQKASVLREIERGDCYQEACGNQSAR